MKLWVRKYGVLLVLLISLAGNLVLFLWGKYWKEALVNQVVSTYEVEQIFLGSGVDASFENIYRVASKRGEFVREMSSAELNMELGEQTRALKVNDTILLFFENRYAGSKSIHPNDGGW
ncbi:hypothetical protein [Hahella sp. CCB-MM4]|uniref:hypothetical protein n=1 Tax=Hahella sp. (strain CCB-MM4) TaxID=1926491 RepID=UPI000B9B7134|nr:hypothetical protein [Hahella sp. CCB-MM4]